MTDDQYTNIMNKLDDLHGDFREHKGTTEAEIANIKEKLRSSELWENVKIVCVMPVMALMHHYLGGKN